MLVEGAVTREKSFGKVELEGIIVTNFYFKITSYKIDGSRT